LLGVIKTDHNAIFYDGVEMKIKHIFKTCLLSVISCHADGKLYGTVPGKVPFMTTANFKRLMVNFYLPVTRKRLLGTSTKILLVGFHKD